MGVDAAERGAVGFDPSHDFSTHGGLRWTQERENQIALTTDREGAKPLEPRLKWHGGITFDPREQHHQISMRDVPLRQSLKKVRKDRLRKLRPPKLWHLVSVCAYRSTPP
jgi:hypothetical protein